MTLSIAGWDGPRIPGVSDPALVCGGVKEEEDLAGIAELFYFK